MAFNIRLADSAVREIAEAVDYIAGDSPVRAQKWLDDLFAALEALRELPNRNAFIPEATELK